MVHSLNNSDCEPEAREFAGRSLIGLVGKAVSTGSIEVGVIPAGVCSGLGGRQVHQCAASGARACDICGAFGHRLTSESGGV
jgi:hypothetical protein